VVNNVSIINTIYMFPSSVQSIRTACSQQTHWRHKHAHCSNKNNLTRFTKINRTRASEAIKRIHLATNIKMPRRSTSFENPSVSLWPLYSQPFDMIHQAKEISSSLTLKNRALMRSQQMLTGRQTRADKVTRKADAFGFSFNSNDPMLLKPVLHLS
jgi:hypothetical protein